MLKFGKENFSKTRIRRRSFQSRSSVFQIMELGDKKKKYSQKSKQPDKRFCSCVLANLGRRLYYVLVSVQLARLRKSVHRGLFSKLFGLNGFNFIKENRDTLTYEIFINISS